MPAFGHAVGAIRANMGAFAAMGAHGLAPHNPGGGFFAFRIGAPETAEGTALEKHKGADARAVEDAVFLDIENTRLHGPKNPPAWCG